MDRRQFIKAGGLGVAGIWLPHTNLDFVPGLLHPDEGLLSFGILADAHHGMLPDTGQRLEKFINDAIERDVDFIIQLGDFCHKEERSKPFLKIWNEFKKPKYHVLGNHDMDLTSKAGIMDFWEMEKAYYSFDFKGIKFIVLDANFLYRDGQFIDYDNANFYVANELRTYINEEQIQWFAATLETSKLPTIVISHQSLWHYQGGVKNRLALQKHMEKFKDKIICCLNGHNHIDFHHRQNGIDYLEINSMSYQWLGDKYKASRYPEALLKDYKWLDHVAPYKDPLYAFATIDPKGVMKIEGVKSEWMPPSPEEMGVPKQVYGNEYSPVISDYEIGGA